MESRQVRMTSSRSDVTLLVVTVFLWCGAAAEKVYFNSYGDCLHNRATNAFSLQDGAFTLLATGAREIHENLICTMTFQAPSDTSICLTFKAFQIDDCGVVLDLYQGSSGAGTPWKRLKCEDRNPPQMCSPERYVTVKLSKRKLNKNKGYAFRITMEKSSSFQGEDAFLASTIGLFVGIIAGVVGIIVIIAVIVLCCCCKPRQSQQASRAAGGGGGKGGGGGDGDGDGEMQSTAALQPPQAQPSAPPAPDMEDEHTPLQPGPGVPMYPALPQQYPGGYTPEEPPPYAPPPYELHNFADKL